MAVTHYVLRVFPVVQFIINLFYFIFTLVS